MIVERARICPGCGEAFTPSSPRQTFHSTGCGTAARVRRHRRNVAATPPDTLRERLLEEEAARGHAVRGADGVYRPTADFAREFGQAFRDLDLWLDEHRDALAPAAGTEL